MSATTIDYQKLQDRRPKRLYYHFWLSVVVGITRGQFLRAGRGRKPQIYCWNCHPVCHSSRYITISDFGSHIAIPGCRSLSQSLGDTLFGLTMVENPGLAAEISTLFQWCNYFQFCWSYRYFWLSFDVTRRARPDRKHQVCRRNCRHTCHTVGDISTSGLDGHIAISGCQTMSHLLVDTFFEFGMVENFVYRARITVILTSDLFICMSLWLWQCALDDDLKLLPVLSVILIMYKYRCLYSCLVILPFSVSNIQKYHICEVYIFADVQCW